MSIAIVVPTYNRRTLFQRSVASVLNQSYKADWFLILDNHCIDGTEQDLEILRVDLAARKMGPQPELVVYRSDENLGAARGMRFLFEKALALGADWIWVMDDDGYADADALERLVTSPQFSQADAYILESAVIEPGGEWSPPNRPALFDEDRFSFTGLPAEAINEKQAIEVHTGPYCGMFIRSVAFKDFGLPRDDFYLWYDDVEFVLRVSRQKKVYLIPQSRVRHAAQALVKYRNCWPFRGPLPEIPFDLLWRYYYLNRNWLWMAKQWLPFGRYSVFWFKHMMRSFLGPVLLGQQYLLIRWNVLGNAGVDALLNRLGARAVAAPKKR